jgi:hypothetical protein
MRKKVGHWNYLSPSSSSSSSSSYTVFNVLLLCMYAILLLMMLMSNTPLLIPTAGVVLEFGLATLRPSHSATTSNQHYLSNWINYYVCHGTGLACLQTPIIYVVDCSINLMNILSPLSVYLDQACWQAWGAEPCNTVVQAKLVTISWLALKYCRLIICGAKPVDCLI